MGIRFFVVRLTLFLICIDFNLCNGCFKNEREALSEFIHSLMPTREDSYYSWVGENCCNWSGVVCDNITGHVTSLAFSDFKVVGSEVSPSLAELNHLNFLFLSGVDFTGSEIPKFFGTFAKLRQLDLSHASFAGAIPPSLGNLSALERLDLSYNQLNGSIPSSLGELSSLTYLNLNSNQLTGPIPSSLGELSSLTYLNLDSNQFSALPSSLGRLSKIEYLSARNNSLNGVVSEIHFLQLSSLKILDLGSNFLIFNTSSSWIPPFQLEILYLKSCKLGPKIPQWLQTQMHLRVLSIPETSISEVPPWFWNFVSRLSCLDVSSNQIHGSVPILQHNVSVYHQSLYLHSNRFEGPLPQFPSNVIELDLRNNSITGSISQHFGDVMVELHSLLLSNNNINGSIPASLCKLNQLNSLDISNNHLSGSVPNCWNVSGYMMWLNLASNNLTGLIPSSLGNFSYLASLQLSNNRFYGEIPPSLKNCSELAILDLGYNELSGNIPSWLGGKSGLLILRLKSNKFGGSLTPQLCGMSHLQILDLSQNQLSGELPPCLHNFTGMKLNTVYYDVGMLYSDVISASLRDQSLNELIKGVELVYTSSLIFLVNLDLSSNNFFGQIPEGLVLLDRLKALNLSNNQLSGEIPRKLGNLTSLESLDFSKNLLSGTIPESISDLGSLGAMNLSFNNLSGKIPSGHQLQTFDSSTYIGNPQLCGFPIDRNCSQDTPSQVIDHQGNVDEGDSGKSGFYIGMTVGTVAGFWGVCAVLFFKRTWRYTFFGFVECVHDRLLLTIALLVLRLNKKHESD